MRTRTIPLLLVVLALVACSADPLDVPGSNPPPIGPTSTASTTKPVPCDDLTDETSCDARADCCTFLGCGGGEDPAPFISCSAKDSPENMGSCLEPSCPIDCGFGTADECDQAPGCYSVYVNQSDLCDCASIYCCIRFDHCAHGFPSCDPQPPITEPCPDAALDDCGPGYVTDYEFGASCGDGCIHDTLCPAPTGGL